MYSIVLLAALSSSPATTPACHWKCHTSCCGCYGGCYGCYGCYGCGGCYGCYGCGGCYGCYGGGWGYGGYGYGVPFVPVMGEGVPAGGTPAVDPKKADDKKTGALVRPAKLVVELPSDAKLFIDGQEMKTPNGKRTFNTPALENGQAYYYELRAEVTIAGRKQIESHRAIIRAGTTTKIDFPELTAAVNRANTGSAVGR